MRLASRAGLKIGQGKIISHLAILSHQLGRTDATTLNYN